MSGLSGEGARVESLQEREDRRFVRALLDDRERRTALGGIVGMTPREAAAVERLARDPAPPRGEGDDLAARAIRETLKALLVVKPELDKPYPTDPRWSPWSRWIDRHEDTPWKLLQRADAALARASSAQSPSEGEACSDEQTLTKERNY